MASSSLPFSTAAPRGQGVTAVLGPTNTGKTTLALERMLAHPSGLIGLPLRLLAREVYTRLVEKAGIEAVALVTGEEKIKPKGAKFWVSTVEAMPTDLDVSFVAIDEVQIAAELERGHVFTDRILNRRGRHETMLLGAATIRPLLEKLLPGLSVITRPRFSQLNFAGDKKITRLPRRTAIVAFGANEVYAIAELIRRQRGGAAVVLGALSPRTRNAQVELYQSGDVDYLIATDAIGMGLNLDVEHVAFASDRKYDGFQHRRLNIVEFAQIAGRAGRSNRDGTFGTTGRCPPLEEELVQALEAHAFPALKVLQWRNSALDFSTLSSLRASLDVIPTVPGLTRAPIAEDQQVLDILTRDDEITERLNHKTKVKRLWEACQMPDYRKISPASHADLVRSIYSHLSRGRGTLPSDWFSQQVALADRIDGDIDTLSMRIAHIRTWTFAATRPDWVDDPLHWQGVTRQVEDKLSDALHERLTQRFVDRRTSVLMRRLRENAMLNVEVSKTGDVVVEGQHVGRIEGFQFAPDPQAGDGEAGRALRAAAAKALAGEIDSRAEKVAAAADDQFILANDGVIRWHGEAVARLVGTDDALSPRVQLLSDEHLTGAPRDAVQARLDLWMGAQIEKLLGPVLALKRAEDLTGLARGIAFQLAEHFGLLERSVVADQVKELDQDQRAALRKYGVRFGAYHIYLPLTLKPFPRALALQLQCLKDGETDRKALSELPALAASGRTSIKLDTEIAPKLYQLSGYRALGERAVRVDILERLADIIRPILSWRPGSPVPEPEGRYPQGGFMVTTAMTSLLGCAGDDFASVLKALGYRMEKKAPPPPPEPASDAAEPTATPDEAATTEVTADTDTITVSEEDSEAPGAGSTTETATPDVAAADVAAETDMAEPPVAAEESTAEEAGAETDAAVEPVLVEVWRPGGRLDHDRPRHHGKGRGHHRPRKAEAPKTPVDTDPFKRQGVEPPQNPPPRPERSDRPKTGDGDKRERFRGEKRERKPDDRPRGVISSEAPRDGRTRVADPNSPFAKLMALKAQMDSKN